MLQSTLCLEYLLGHGRAGVLRALSSRARVKQVVPEHVYCKLLEIVEVVLTAARRIKLVPDLVMCSLVRIPVLWDGLTSCDVSELALSRCVVG